jgi:hypothetical protein
LSRKEIAAQGKQRSTHNRLACQADLPARHARRVLSQRAKKRSGGGRMQRISEAEAAQISHRLFAMD